MVYQNKLPQEGSQSVKSFPGVLTPGCLTDSGGDKFCDGGKSGQRVVGNQASAFPNATGRRKYMEEGAVVEVVKAFARSSKPQRSPVRRNNSLLEYFPTVDTSSPVTQTSMRLREESRTEEEKKQLWRVEEAWGRLLMDKGATALDQDGWAHGDIELMCVKRMSITKKEAKEKEVQVGCLHLVDKASQTTFLKKVDKGTEMQKAGPYTRKKEGKRREMRDEMNPGIRLDDATFGHKPKHMRSHSGTDSTQGISRTEDQAKPNLIEVKQGQRSDKGHTQKENGRRRLPQIPKEPMLVKSQVEKEESGGKVMSLRKSNNGELVIRLGKKQARPKHCEKQSQTKKSRESMQWLQEKNRASYKELGDGCQ
ncbi:hypothetical protein J6590_007256 [Homalodisca vitripennis]|nr:hypothetical protein J6590_007256 [Homalodisca vitripennis]